MSGKNQNDLEKVLQLPDKGVYQVQGVGGVLAQLVRTIWMDNKMRAGDIEQRIGDFVSKARDGLDSKSMANYFNRSNLRRELCRPSMTWKVFIKALRIMRVTKLEIAIRLKYADKPSETIHVVKTDLGEGSFNMDDYTEN